MIFSNRPALAAILASAFIASTMLALSAPAHAEPVSTAEEAKARIYNDGGAASAAVAAAQAHARTHATNVVVIFGTERCHDTRALLDWIAKDDVIQSLSPSYELVLVESGIARDRNLDLARKLGVNRIEGTPSLIILSGRNGKVLNRKVTAKLRSAASMTPEQRMAYFDKYRP